MVKWKSMKRQEKYFEPFIEGVLGECRQPIFAKVLSYGMRIVRLPKGLVAQHDHTEQARRLAVDHNKQYVQRTIAETFPIRYYVYFTTVTRGVRISVDGRVLGVFADRPANPSLRIGTKYYV